MAKGTLINLFLLDGTANGRMKCTIKSRTGVIFKIPRKDLAASKELDGLDNDGVYFLFGAKDEQPTIYIGQAGSRKNGKGIISRLCEHDRKPDKDFWTEALVLTTSNNSFGPTEISWLENKFCNMAIEASRCVVKNGNDPSPGNLTEEKIGELEEHIEFTKLILGAIGYKIFEPQKDLKPDEEIFYLSRKINALGKSVNARMQCTNKGYKVLAGSEISPIDTEQLSEKLKQLRNSAQVDVNGKLLEDMEFKSPSAAAMFVIGNSSNGLVDWKTKDGVMLKDLQGGN